jgi:hypothetical protein
MSEIGVSRATEQEHELGHCTVGPNHEERSVWIYTGYAAAVLGLLGVLAYHFSTYVLK